MTGATHFGEIGPDGAPTLDTLVEWTRRLRETAPPRALVHAHFEVTEYRRQWMTDGSVMHWVPLAWLLQIDWRKHRDDTPPYGLAHSLGTAAYTGIPVLVTDPFGVTPKRNAT